MHPIFAVHLILAMRNSMSELASTKNEILDQFKNMVETSVNLTSVFDLSPTEKLQLVEDLWDDLATTPETVPVHDWQKQELARRKANLLSNPASGLSWEEVKRRVRNRYGR
jgi:putative addiction module component (TIGR02574 family)